MPRTIRFHLDEHCPHGIAQGLRRYGIDVTTAIDASLLRASDEEHLAFCVAQTRVILTRDEDYLSLNAASVPHCGIVYCHLKKRLTIGEIIAALVLIWEVFEAHEMMNRVECLASVESGRSRCLG
jgi:predicted nuclease of predicted toxin-antitoxin system